MHQIEQMIEELSKLNSPLFGTDTLLTWERKWPEVESLLLIAELLKTMHSQNISTQIFDSGLAVSQFRDNSTRTRFSFASAVDMLGLAVSDLDEGKSQMAHGETVRETSNMISFLTEVIGIRDDKFLGEGNRYMREVASALDDGVSEGVLNQRPTVVNLQCDIDHPTQTLSDLLHLKKVFGSLENLKGKKLAMSWAYSPSYGKPLSVPQGIIGLMSRLGMEVVLAHPTGYELMPETVELANKQSQESGGSFLVTDSMDDAFAGADIVYPKSWAPYSVMQERLVHLKNGNLEELRALEHRWLEQNGEHVSWECNRQRMDLTNKKDALYMHCLPADITGLSCREGEVTEEVFSQYRVQTYIEAGYKPFIIAALIFASKTKNPAVTLSKLMEKKINRVQF
ncbi:MAG: knotted carbamoyltransferase YgeW [Bdellovibrionales bacterium]|nr:knotted carbamoyltransferase YgeW [Bdellovibrionales bacterium]